MKNIIVRHLLMKDYDGVREVDIKTQRQYLGEKFDKMGKREQDKHLVSRESEFLINANSPYCFVAILDNKIIGFLLAYETVPFLKNIYIRYIGLDPQYQGRGIGKLLYGQLIKTARRKKIKTIKALINLDNPNSMSLHKKVGFNLVDRKEAVFKLS